MTGARVIRHAWPAGHLGPVRQALQGPPTARRARTAGPRCSSQRLRCPSALDPEVPVTETVAHRRSGIPMISNHFLY